MRAFFVSAVHGLRISGRYGRGLRLSDRHYLTNEPAAAFGQLSAAFRESAGALETESLLRAPVVVFSHSVHEEENFADKDAQSFIALELGVVQLFLLSLWLVKDNAVNLDTGFLERPFAGGHGMTLSSNTRAVRFTSASGEHRPVEFDPDELRRARDLFRTAFHSTPSTEATLPDHMLPSDADRLARVLYYLQAARGAPDLGTKISFYVTCFEALFSTDSSELAHKLSERVAFFCQDLPAERLRAFRLAKLAYAIRSKTVHGDRLPKRLIAQAAEVSIECDGLLRATLNKILGSDDLRALFMGDNQPLEDHLTRMVFGCVDSSPDQN